MFKQASDEASFKQRFVTKRHHLKGKLLMSFTFLQHPAFVRPLSDIYEGYL
jgi:hypothetical protein